MCNPDKLNTSCNKVSSNIFNDIDITIIPQTSPISDTLEEDMHYENMILLFNTSIIDDTITDFCQMYNLQNML